MSASGAVAIGAAAGRTAPVGLGALVAIGAVVSLASGARRRRRRSELRDRLAGAAEAGPATGSVRTGAMDPVANVWRAVAVAVGSRSLQVVGRPAEAGTARRIGGALLLAAVVVVAGAGPVVASVVAVAAWSAPLVRRLARRARARAALVDELPEVVDLVRLGIGSGLNVRLALDAVVRHHEGPIAVELGAALARVDRGERLADALDRITPESAAVAPLIDALVATERYGAPLVSALDRVAGDARLARRRRREEAARRVPVLLLFPLVFCTLPAFALLTVVPVLLRSLPSLSP